MGTIIFLSVITVLVLVGIVLSIVLIKKSKNSDSGIIDYFTENEPSIFI